MKELNNEKILEYQKSHANKLKSDLCKLWQVHKSFNLKALYAQWLVLAYTQDLITPRVRTSPAPCDIQLYDESTQEYICARLGILK